MTQVDGRKTADRSMPGALEHLARRMKEYDRLGPAERDMLVLRVQLMSEQARALVGTLKRMSLAQEAMTAEGKGIAWPYFREEIEKTLGLLPGLLDTVPRPALCPERERTADVR